MYWVVLLLGFFAADPCWGFSQLDSLGTGRDGGSGVSMISLSLKVLDFRLVLQFSREWLLRLVLFRGSRSKEGKRSASETECATRTFRFSAVLAEVK